MAPCQLGHDITPSLSAENINILELTSESSRINYLYTIPHDFDYKEKGKDRLQCIREGCLFEDESKKFIKEFFEDKEMENFAHFIGIQLEGNKYDTLQVKREIFSRQVESLKNTFSKKDIPLSDFKLIIEFMGNYEDPVTGEKLATPDTLLTMFDAMTLYRQERPETLPVKHIRNPMNDTFRVISEYLIHHPNSSPEVAYEISLAVTTPKGEEQKGRLLPAGEFPQKEVLIYTLTKKYETQGPSLSPSKKSFLFSAIKNLKDNMEIDNDLASVLEPKWNSFLNSDPLIGQTPVYPRPPTRFAAQEEPGVNIFLNNSNGESSFWRRLNRYDSDSGVRDYDGVISSRNVEVPSYLGGAAGVYVDAANIPLLGNFLDLLGSGIAQTGAFGDLDEMVKNAIRNMVDKDSESYNPEMAKLLDDLFFDPVRGEKEEERLGFNIDEIRNNARLEAVIRKVEKECSHFGAQVGNSVDDVINCTTSVFASEIINKQIQNVFDLKSNVIENNIDPIITAQTDQVVESYKKCLEKGGHEARPSAICLERFKRSIGPRLGYQLIGPLISKNFQDYLEGDNGVVDEDLLNNFIQNGRESFEKCSEEVYLPEYDRFLKSLENYKNALKQYAQSVGKKINDDGTIGKRREPVPEHISILDPRSTGEDGEKLGFDILGYTKACAFNSIINLLENPIKNELKKNIDEMFPEEQREQVLLDVEKEVWACFESKDYAKDGRANFPDGERLEELALNVELTKAQLQQNLSQKYEINRKRKKRKDDLAQLRQIDRNLTELRTSYEAAKEEYENVLTLVKVDKEIFMNDLTENCTSEIGLKTILKNMVLNNDTLKQTFEGRGEDLQRVLDDTWMLGYRACMGEVEFKKYLAQRKIQNEINIERLDYRAGFSNYRGRGELEELEEIRKISNDFGLSNCLDYIKTTAMELLFKESLVKQLELMTTPLLENVLTSLNEIGKNDLREKYKEQLKSIEFKINKNIQECFGGLRESALERIKNTENPSQDPSLITENEQMGCFANALGVLSEEAGQMLFDLIIKENPRFSKFSRYITEEQKDNLLKLFNSCFTGEVKKGKTLDEVMTGLKTNPMSCSLKVIDEFYNKYFTKLIESQLKQQLIGIIPSERLEELSNQIIEKLNPYYNKAKAKITSEIDQGQVDLPKLQNELIPVLEKATQEVSSLVLNQIVGDLLISKARNSEGDFNEELFLRFVRQNRFTNENGSFNEKAYNEWFNSYQIKLDDYAKNNQNNDEQKDFYTFADLPARERMDILNANLYRDSLRLLSTETSETFINDTMYYIGEDLFNSVLEDITLSSLPPSLNEPPLVYEKNEVLQKIKDNFKQCLKSNDGPAKDYLKGANRLKLCISYSLIDSGSRLLEFVFEKSVVSNLRSLTDDPSQYSKMKNELMSKYRQEVVFCAENLHEKMAKELDVIVYTPGKDIEKEIKELMKCVDLAKSFSVKQVGRQAFSLVMNTLFKEPSDAEKVFINREINLSINSALRALRRDPSDLDLVLNIAKGNSVSNILDRLLTRNLEGFLGSEKTNHLVNGFQVGDVFYPGAKYEVEECLLRIEGEEFGPRSLEDVSIADGTPFDYIQLKLDDKGYRSALNMPSKEFDAHLYSCLSITTEKVYKKVVDDLLQRFSPLFNPMGKGIIEYRALQCLERAQASILKGKEWNYENLKNSEINFNEFIDQLIKRDSTPPSCVDIVYQDSLLEIENKYVGQALIGIEDFDIDKEEAERIIRDGFKSATKLIEKIDYTSLTGSEDDEGSKAGLDKETMELVDSFLSSFSRMANSNLANNDFYDEIQLFSNNIDNYISRQIDTSSNKNNPITFPELLILGFTANSSNQPSLGFQLIQNHFDSEDILEDNEFSKEFEGLMNDFFLIPDLLPWDRKTSYDVQELPFDEEFHGGGFENLIKTIAEVVGDSYDYDQEGTLNALRNLRQRMKNKGESITTEWFFNELVNSELYPLIVQSMLANTFKSQIVESMQEQAIFSVEPLLSKLGYAREKPTPPYMKTITDRNGVKKELYFSLDDILGFLTDEQLSQYNDLKNDPKFTEKKAIGYVLKSLGMSERKMSTTFYKINSDGSLNKSKKYSLEQMRDLLKESDPYLDSNYKIIANGRYGSRRGRALRPLLSEEEMKTVYAAFGNPRDSDVIGLYDRIEIEAKLATRPEVIKRAFDSEKGRLILSSLERPVKKMLQQQAPVSELLLFTSEERFLNSAMSLLTSDTSSDGFMFHLAKGSTQDGIWAEAGNLTWLLKDDNVDELFTGPEGEKKLRLMANTILIPMVQNYRPAEGADPVADFKKVIQDHMLGWIPSF